ncbi:MAG: diguanylate cyclase [Nevskia sp.]|nr:diguanylate cyclase [Nevskia sp.]
MPEASTPDDENIRAWTLCSIALLDTPPEERFDRLTRLARRLFEVPAALVTLVDGQRVWFKSCDGLDLRQVLRDRSFCAHAIQGEEMLVVPDALADARFRDSPLVAGERPVRFYAGYPLVVSNGARLGTFCLLDFKPRQLDEEQRQALRDLAHSAALAIDADLAQARLRANEKILRESEMRMALAIAGSGTGIWDRNIPTGEIHYSSGWKAMLGYSDSEVSNRIEDSYKRVHPDDLAYVQGAIQAHFERKTESYEVEHRIRCKDGSYKWILSRGKVVVRDAQGGALRMIGTTSDITAKRALSERLQQSFDLISSLTNEVPGLVFQYRMLRDGQSFFSYASAGIRDIYELEPEQVAASVAEVHKIIHPDDLARYCASLEASAASLTPWHLEYRVLLPRQGLRWRQGDARPQRLADGSTVWHGFITDVTERKRIEAELQEFATVDYLTQLPNRRYFMARIEEELARIRRADGMPAVVMMCDLDHFKAINDRCGHAAGDQALKHFAGILGQERRKSDLVSRVGGEEFAVLLCDAGVEAAVAFAGRLQQRLAEMPLQTGGYRISLTVSIGIATMTAADSSADLALSRSDRALYRAKERGRNRVECY